MPITQSRLLLSLSTIQTLTHQRDKLKSAIQYYHDEAKTGADPRVCLGILLDISLGDDFKTPAHMYENYVNEMAHIRATESHNRAKRKWLAKKKLQEGIAAYESGDVAQAQEAAWQDYKSKLAKARETTQHDLPKPAPAKSEDFSFDQLPEDDQDNILRKARQKALMDAGQNVEAYKAAMALPRSMAEKRALDQAPKAPEKPPSLLDSIDEVDLLIKEQQRFLAANPQFCGKP